MHYPVMTEKHLADRWQLGLKTLQRWRVNDPRLKARAS